MARMLKGKKSENQTMSEPRVSYNVTHIDRKAFNGAVKTELRRLASSDALNYRSPEPSFVLALIQDAGWQQTEVANLLRVNVSTVRRWTASTEQAQSRAIPFAAWVVLLVVAGHATFGSNGDVMSA